MALKRLVEQLVPGMVVIGEHGGRSVVLGYPEQAFVDGTVLSMVATEHGVLARQIGVKVNIDAVLFDLDAAPTLNFSQ